MKTIYTELFDLAMQFNTFYEFRKYLKENPVFEVIGHNGEIMKFDCSQPTIKHHFNGDIQYGLPIVNDLYFLSDIFNEAQDYANI